jgi:hypothetical protein
LPIKDGTLKDHSYQTDPRKIYDGPEFDEYCIREGGYLPASRDRSECAVCPLGNLCQAGFEEQVRKVTNGENPSLTDCKVFAEEALMPENLVVGLSDDQVRFVKKYVPGF